MHKSNGGYEVVPGYSEDEVMYWNLENIRIGLLYLFRMKNGVEVPTGVRSRYRVKCEGTKHFLVIDDASRDDTGTYSLMATGGTSEAHVQVDCMYIYCIFTVLLTKHPFSSFSASSYC